MLVLYENITLRIFQAFVKLMLKQSRSRFDNSFPVDSLTAVITVTSIWNKRVNIDLPIFWIKMISINHAMATIVLLAVKFLRKFDTLTIVGDM